MPAYFVVHHRVTDAKMLQEYVRKAHATMAPFKPELLVADDNSTVLEGKTDLPRTIMFKFESREAALAWYNSPEYRAVLPLRLEATEGYALLLDGFVVPQK